MAPLTRRQKRARAAASAPPPPPPLTDAADDRISGLHPDIQAQILSFLPAREAVQTCVLARAWRDVWKSTSRLLIAGSSVHEVRGFVDGLLRARARGGGGAPLDACEFRFRRSSEKADEDDDDDYHGFSFDDSYVLNRWIRSAMESQIRMLRVDVSNFDSYFELEMDGKPLVSRHLTRLELRGVWLWPLNLDGGCPRLEHLEIHGCSFLEHTTRDITSMSLRRLVITSCTRIGDDGEPIRIRAPRLVSLLLDDMDFRTPLLLERMPELMDATVQIHSRRDGDFDSDDDEEDYDGQNTAECVLLEGLAHARHLVLIADPSTVHLKYDVVVEGRPDATLKSTMISQHLQIVELKCFQVNQSVLKVLRFLGTLNIWFQFRAAEGSR